MHARVHGDLEQDLDIQSIGHTDLAMYTRMEILSRF